MQRNDMENDRVEACVTGFLEGFFWSSWNWPLRLGKGGR